MPISQASLALAWTTTRDRSIGRQAARLLTNIKRATNIPSCISVAGGIAFSPVTTGLLRHCSEGSSSMDYSFRSNTT